MDINQNYCDDHFKIYTNIESVCSTPETNMRLRMNYLNKIELQI